MQRGHNGLKGACTVIRSLAPTNSYYWLTSRPGWSQPWRMGQRDRKARRTNACGHYLLDLFSDLDLFVTDANFQLKYCLQATWMHPRSRHWHLLELNYVVTSMFLSLV